MFEWQRQIQLMVDEIDKCINEDNCLYIKE